MGRGERRQEGGFDRIFPKEQKKINKKTGMIWNHPLPQGMSFNHPLVHHCIILVDFWVRTPSLETV